MLEKQFSRLANGYDNSIRAISDWLTPSRVKIYPRMIAIMMFIAWFISQLMGPGLTDSVQTTIGIDFLAYYTAGKFFWTNQLANLYQAESQMAFQQNLVAPAITNKFQFFVSPPYTLPLYAPFALPGYIGGLFAWWGMCFFAIFISLYLLRDEFLKQENPGLLKLFLISFTFYPTLMSFFSGQSTALLLLIYAAILVFLRRKQDLLAGLALGLLVYKPTLALGLGLALLFKFRWKALLGGALSGGSWIASGFLFFPALMRTYMQESSYLLRFAINDPWGALSLNEFSILLLEDAWQTGSVLLSGVLTGAAIIVLFIFWKRTSWDPGSRAWDMTMASTIMIGLLISQHLGIYDAMLLLPCFAILWHYYPNGTKGRLLDRGPLLAWSAILYIAAFLSMYITLLQSRLTAMLGLPAMSIQFLTIILAIWGWLIYRDGQQVTIPTQN